MSKASLIAQAKSTRDLAGQARRLSSAVNEADRQRLLGYAEDLDQKAARLEAEAATIEPC